MIAIPRQCRSSVPAWHEPFLAMAPTIVRQASLACKDMNPDAREEMIQEVLCNALVAYKRLYDQGRVELAYPTVLAMFGIRQAFEGRKVGGRLNVKDVSSPYAQRSKGFKVDRLDRFDREQQAWQQILIEDRTATPADLAATRIDFEAWLKTLSKRDRSIAMDLAVGERTGTVAQRYGISPSRISQLRGQLKVSWDEFTDQIMESATTASA